MKTILVDAVHGLFIPDEGINEPMYKLLESYLSKKIILTGAKPDRKSTV